MEQELKTHKAEEVTLAEQDTTLAKQEKGILQHRLHNCFINHLY